MKANLKEKIVKGIVIGVGTLIGTVVSAFITTKPDPVIESEDYGVQDTPAEDMSGTEEVKEE